MLGQYEILSKIGSGTYGSVLKARDIKSGDIVAVKKFKKQYTSREEAFEACLFDYPKYYV